MNGMIGPWFCDGHGEPRGDAVTEWKSNHFEKF
jgi:hypothetical protein